MGTTGFAQARRMLRSTDRRAYRVARPRCCAPPPFDDARQIIARGQNAI
jgi:hypothetical protein